MSNKYYASIKVDKSELEFCNLLIQENKYREDTEEVPYTYTCKFLNGIEADIKVVNADSPYIDAILFDENGFELSVLEPEFERLDGQYIFYLDKDMYTVTVE